MVDCSAHVSYNSVIDIFEVIIIVVSLSCLYIYNFSVCCCECDGSGLPLIFFLLLLHRFPPNLWSVVYMCITNFLLVSITSYGLRRQRGLPISFFFCLNITSGTCPRQVKCILAPIAQQ